VSRPLIRSAVGTFGTVENWTQSTRKGSGSSGTTASRRPFGMSTSTSGTSASRRANRLNKEGHTDNAQRLDGFTWHCLRHTFASRLAMAGVDLLVIKELGGWKTLSMVNRYAHLAPGRLREGIERVVTGGPGLESEPGASGTRSGTGTQRPERGPR
jgi:site-specific recombinase XerD